MPVISIRAPKGGGGSGGHGSSGHSSSSGSRSSSSSSSSGKTGKGKGIGFVGGSGHRHHGGGGPAPGGGGGHLAVWKIVLIVLGTIFAALFLCSCIWYTMREKRRAAKEGTRFRLWWVLGKSFAFASSIGIFIWLFRRLQNKRKQGKSYEKMQGEGEDEREVAPDYGVPYSHYDKDSKHEPLGYDTPAAAPPAAFRTGGPGAAADYYRPPPPGA